MQDQLTQSRLKELLEFDPETGVFTWRVPTSVRVQAGSIVTTTSHGYTVVGIDNVRYPCHRLAFLYMTGAFPSGQVDHINGVRNDNRWANLREATASENAHNIGCGRRDNTSGFLGVCFHKKAKKWMGQIAVDGRRIYLGLFATPELAHAAYLKAKDELHPTHRRLRGAE